MGDANRRGTREQRVAEATARTKAVEKAKAAGLTDDDLRALGVTA